MLKTLKIQNFTCFPKADLKFSKGLNVIVGENGTGKSHILKLGYTALRALSQPYASFAKNAFARDFARHLVAVFQPDTLGRLASRTYGHSSSRLDVQLIPQSENEKTEFSCNFSTSSTDLVNITEFLRSHDVQQPVFIPPKEILSIFPGFQHTLENRELNFDGTYLDLAKSLAANSLKGPSLKAISRYLDPLETLLEGQVSLKNGAFYFSTLSASSTNDLEAQLMPEGYRKLGMIMHLLKTGELRQRSSLFWDEPEANLNPKLIAKLAEILVDLSKIMQITIATHSLFLLRELDIFLKAQENKNEIAMFTGLHIQEQRNVECIQSESLNEIGDIAALDASLDQTDRFMKARVS